MSEVGDCLCARSYRSGGCELRRGLVFELLQLGELELELAEDVGHGAGLLEERRLAEGPDHVAESEGGCARLGLY